MFSNLESRRSTNAQRDRISITLPQSRFDLLRSRSIRYGFDELLSFESSVVEYFDEDGIEGDVLVVSPGCSDCVNRGIRPRTEEEEGKESGRTDDIHDLGLKIRQDNNPQRSNGSNRELIRPT